MFNIPFSLLENFSCGLSLKAEWLQILPYNKTPYYDLGTHIIIYTPLAACLVKYIYMITGLIKTLLYITLNGRRQAKKKVTTVPVV